MRRSWKTLAILLFTLAIAAGGIFGTRLQALTEDTRESMRLYTELVSIAQENYGAEVEYKDLVYASIHGMMRALDPHTSFLPPRAYSGMRERQQSSFYGLGILVGVRNGRVTVITPIEGGPASRLGIQTGDIIDTIDGESTEPMSLDDAIGKLKGPKDTEVVITVLRSGVDESIEMKIIRDEIPHTTVRYSYMLEPEVGYMRVTDFNRGTGREVAEALKQLREQGMKRLLLDLRNNGGGLLDQAIEVADQFVPKGSKIVETRGRTRNSHQTYFAENRYQELDLPVVVLVNSGTASAAEILSGAIQDHDIGLVAGTPTWGKGLVQTVYSLSYGAGVALTTARYYTPSGRLIQRDYSSFYDYYTYEGGAPDDEGPSVPTETEPEVEKFETDLGRAVYGGGGITPDFVIEPGEISYFLQVLHSRAAFFNFGVKLNTTTPATSRDWKPSEKTLAEFREWILEQEFVTQELAEEGFAEDENREYVLRQIRAEAFNAAFGQDDWHRTLSQGDAQIRGALDLFPKADELLVTRRSLQAEIDQEAVQEKKKG